MENRVDMSDTPAKVRPAASGIDPAKKQETQSRQ